MCRSIKVLRQPNISVTTEDVNAAALQFVRKISGYRSPSRVNEQAFSQAVREIAESSRRLLDALTPRSPESTVTTSESISPIGKTFLSR